MKTEQQIQEMADKATDAIQNPRFSGMTYEQGVEAALSWVLGFMDDESPLE